MSRELVAAFCAASVFMGAGVSASAAGDDAGDPADPTGMTPAGLDFGYDDYEDDDSPWPAFDRFYVDSEALPGSGSRTTIGGDFRFGDVTAGPFSSLSHAPSIGIADNAWTGAVGLQASTRLDTAIGPLEPQLQFSLADDFDIGGGRFEPWREHDRRNLYVEHFDPAQFDFENALSLRMKGIVPGYFHYETRIRVRMTGIREVTGRIRFKW